MTPRHAKITHPGGRRVNEDAVAVRDSVWVVCDGVGGHRNGEVASAKVAEAVADILSGFKVFGEEAVAAAITTAREVFTDDESGMKTTLVLAWLRDGVLLTAHIGDSRAMLIREGAILHQTQDHSVVAALLAAGEIQAHERRAHPNRNRLTRALGREEKGEVVISEPIPLQDGDAILLCSDGLWEFVEDSEFVFDRVKTEDPADWLRRLFRRAFGRAPSDHDNASAVAVMV